MGSPEYVYAHEMSHQMGLLDEYASDSAPQRKVYTDHSIMGDYVNEGMHAGRGEAAPRRAARRADRRGHRQGPQGPLGLNIAQDSFGASRWGRKGSCCGGWPASIWRPRSISAFSSAPSSITRFVIHSQTRKMITAAMLP